MLIACKNIKKGENKKEEQNLICNSILFDVPILDKAFSNCLKLNLLQKIK